MNLLKKNLPQIAAAIAAVIFGFAFLFAKNALDYLEVFQLIGLRFLTAALLLTFLKIIGIIKVKINYSRIKTLLLIALFQPVLYFIFETKGVDLTTASLSGVIISLVPIVVTLFSAILLRESLRCLQWISVFISLAGAILIILPGSIRGGTENTIGVLFLFGAVLSAGFYNILSRKVSKSFTPFEITYVMMWAGAIIFNTIGIIEAKASNNLMNYFSDIANVHVLIDILYLGILASVLAFLLLNYSLSKMEASKSVMFMNLTPLVSVLAGVFLRGEKFYLLQCIGGIIIILGLFLINSKLTSNNKPGYAAKKQTT